MSKEDYIFYLNDLTDKERSVFLYCFILKISQSETSNHLKLSIHKVNKIVQNIKQEINVLPLKQEIFDAFSLRDI